MTDTLIQNARVLQIHNEQVTILDAHDILIKGNRIEAIQPTGKVDASHFPQVIDARGKLAMPGLINTHAHTPMVYWRGLAEDVNIDEWFNDYIWPLESNLQAGDVYWGMQLGLLEMIESGVTSVNDHYFYMDEAAEAVEKAGTRALLGWAMFSSNGYEQIEEVGGAFAQRWQNAANGRIRTCLAPHAPYTCDDDFLNQSAQLAEKLGLMLHIHAAETIEQTEASLQAHGKTPIEVLEYTGILDQPTILAHVCGATPGDIETLTQYQVGIAHTPKTYMKLAMGYAPITDFRMAGIKVGLGTDGACSNNTMDIMEAMRLTAMLQKIRTHDARNLTIPQALTIATQESAAVFGLPNDLGDLVPGKLADVILVDVYGAHSIPLHNMAANLVYNIRASDVQTVMVDGEVVMRDRKVLTLDKGEIYAEVTKRMERMARRESANRIQTYKP